MYFTHDLQRALPRSVTHTHRDCIPLPNYDEWCICIWYTTAWNTCSSHSKLFFDLSFAGDSANAVPLTKKLRTRVTCIWGDRRGQPARSAMDRPRPGRTPLLIRVSPVPGKYAYISNFLRPTVTHFLLKCGIFNFHIYFYAIKFRKECLDNLIEKILLKIHVAIYFINILSF